MSSSIMRYLPGLGARIQPRSRILEHPTASPTDGGLDSPAHSRDLCTVQSLSDEALISLICKEDKEALAELFRRHARIVRGVAHRVLRDASEADDLLQDIFLLIHRLCGTFDSSKGSARFWILQMTYRRAISRRRYLTSRHFYTRVDLEQVANELGGTASGSGHPETSICEGIDRKGTLQNWFSELSENQRQTLHFFFFDGYTFEEIAAKLGQTVGNARNHYYRGLEKLRRQISAGKCRAKHYDKRL